MFCFNSFQICSYEWFLLAPFLVLAECSVQDSRYGSEIPSWFTAQSRWGVDPSPGTYRGCPWLQGLWQELRTAMERVHKEHAFHCPKQRWVIHKSQITNNLWELQSLPKFSYYKPIRTRTLERPVNSLLVVVQQRRRVLCAPECCTAATSIHRMQPPPLFSTKEPG